MTDIVGMIGTTRPRQAWGLMALVPVIVLMAGPGCGPDQGEVDRLSERVTRLEQDQAATADQVAELVEQHREMAAEHQAPMGAMPMGAMPMGAAPTSAAPTGAAPTGAAPMGAAPMGDDPPMAPSGGGMGEM